MKTLRTLSRKEQAELLRFAKSGLSASGEKEFQLLEYILNCAPGFKAKQLKKEAVFQVLFRKEEYNDTKLRLLLSDVLRTVNQFIGIKMMLNEPYELEMQQLEHFTRVENNDFTLKRIEEFAKKINAIPFHNESYFYLQFRVEQLKSHFLSKRSKDYPLDKLFRNLESFYFLNKLRLTCVRLSNNFIFRNDAGHLFLDEIKESLAKNTYPDNQIILGYSYSILLLTGEAPEAQFRRLYELLNAHEKELGEQERSIFGKILENYCIRQINSGSDSYYPMLYHLLEHRLSAAAEISSGEVKTFITLCLRMGKADTAERFIQNKKQQILPEDIREDAYNYSLSQLYFHNRKFDQVLLMLQQVEYLNIFYKIDSKKLLIETFFELKEWDSLYSAMNAFRVYIHRNSEISDVHKKNNQNFINFLYKLMNANPNDEKRLNKLRQQLTRSRHIAERKWLMEKLNERIAQL